MMLSVDRLRWLALARAALVGSFLSLGSVSCYDEQLPAEPEPEISLDVQLRQSLQGWGLVLPIAEIPARNPALVELGRSLFFDKLLSGNRDISCATCHDPVAHSGDQLSLAVGTGFTGTGTSRAPGHSRSFVPRNAPSLFNQGLTFPYLFWDGRLEEFGPNGRPRTPTGVVLPLGLDNLLAAQAMLPVLNRAEMRGLAGDRDRFGILNELAAIDDENPDEIWAAAMRRVLAVPEYVTKFSAAFPGVPPSLLGFQHAANAIAAFEIQAFTKTRTGFDRFLARDARAMSDEAKRGGILFFGRARCVQCHSGPMMGGQQFANIGVPQVGPGVGLGAPLDFGRGEENPQFEHARFMFRAPQLRNVELSAPYMHNGAYPTLEAVVQHYSNADSALRHYDPSQLAPALRGMYHGDAATIEAVARTMDPRVRFAIRLAPNEQRDLVAFLKSLTDPSARDLSAIAPSAVPSGLPLRN
jgi:cytochrome c peroxidase